MSQGLTSSSTRNRWSTARNARTTASGPSASMSSGDRPSVRRAPAARPSPGETPHEVVDRLGVAAVQVERDTPASQGPPRGPRGRSPAPGRGRRRARPRGRRREAPRARGASRRRSPGPRRRRSRGTAVRASRSRSSRARGRILVPPRLGNRDRSFSQDARLAPQVLAQLVERPDLEEARGVGDGRHLLLEHAGQRRVEADEQGLEALRGRAAAPSRRRASSCRSRRRPRSRRGGRPQRGWSVPNCPSVSRTTSRSPPAISLRSIGRISMASVSVAFRRSMAAWPGGRVPAWPLQTANARSTNAPSSRRPPSSSTNIDWSAMRSGSTSGPRSPWRPRIESSSTSGNATAWPAIGFRPAVQPGNSESLRMSECRLSAACSKGLRGSDRPPTHHVPRPSRRTSPDFTSSTRIPRSGSPMTMSASPSRS